MKGFARALQGEIYLWTRKASWRWALIGVALLAAGRVLLGRLTTSPESGAWNFWPQFASGARTGMFLAELLTLVLLASSLPREVTLGAARDPLVRGISRSAFIAARACIALLLPLSLMLAAVLAAAGTGALCFDAGDVVEEGEVLMSVADDNLDGLVYRAILHGLPPLLALAAVALALSALSRHAVVAVGLGLALVLLPAFLHDPMAGAAPWFFADTLAGLGADSYLARIAQFAQGYSSAYPETFDAVVRTGWIAPWPGLILGWALAILFFRRRAI